MDDDDLVLSMLLGNTKFVVCKMTSVFEQDSGCSHRRTVGRSAELLWWECDPSGVEPTSGYC